jgi:hypothetical protein
MKRKVSKLQNKIFESLDRPNVLMFFEKLIEANL